MRGREPASVGLKRRKKMRGIWLRKWKRNCKHQISRKRYKAESSGRENQGSNTGNEKEERGIQAKTISKLKFMCC